MLQGEGLQSGDVGGPAAVRVATLAMARNIIARRKSRAPFIEMETAKSRDSSADAS
jgi:hypothetical protein